MLSHKQPAYVMPVGDEFLGGRVGNGKEHFHYNNALNKFIIVQPPVALTQ